jgi:hypothetical protein
MQQRHTSMTSKESRPKKSVTDALSTTRPRSPQDVLEDMEMTKVPHPPPPKSHQTPRKSSKQASNKSAESLSSCGKGHQPGKEVSLPKIASLRSAERFMRLAAAGQSLETGSLGSSGLSLPDIYKKSGNLYKTSFQGFLPGKESPSASSADHK